MIFLQHLVLIGYPTTEQKKDLLLAEQVHAGLVCRFWEILYVFLNRD